MSRIEASKITMLKFCHSVQWVFFPIYFSHFIWQFCVYQKQKFHIFTKHCATISKFSHGKLHITNVELNEGNCHIRQKEFLNWWFLFLYPPCACTTSTPLIKLIIVLMGIHFDLYIFLLIILQYFLWIEAKSIHEHVKKIGERIGEIGKIFKKIDCGG